MTPHGSTPTTLIPTQAPHAPGHIEELIPSPGLREVDSVELALPVERAWTLVRHADLGDATIVRALFAIRTLPDLLRGKPGGAPSAGLDGLVSTPERPQFGILVDDPPNTVVVGAIGKVWKPEIEFVHVPDAASFAVFDRPGFVRVAWALSVGALTEGTTRVTLELRVDATDAGSWGRFRRYFRVVGPPSRLIRRRVLGGLGRRHGVHLTDDERALPGDDLLPDAAVQVTHAVTLAASHERVWPWLVQMGRGRAGWYGLDLLDNGGRRSAREIHPEFQQVAVSELLPADVRGDVGFEVLRVDPGRALVLGGLHDRAANRQLPFSESRPGRFWQVTWAFVLTPQSDGTTRLAVRARAAFDPSSRLHARWIRPVHHVMQGAQLRGLAARAEGRLPGDDWRDVAEGIGGAAIMATAALTPFLRAARCRWGLDAPTAARPLPGDDLVPTPGWQWTHGIEVAAPAERVWPWVAQMGADRGGFLSYQWLENVVGCGLRNAEVVHPEWEVRPGDQLVLHPSLPLPVVHLEPGRCFVAHATPEPAGADGRARGAAATWLFLVEPFDRGRCRVISRYRVATSPDLPTRLRFGPTLVEPVGFAMDRRMLLGIREHAEVAERARRRRTPPTTASAPPAAPR